MSHQTRLGRAIKRGEAVGPVQPPELEPLAVHALHRERPRRSAMSAVCGRYRPSRPSYAQGKPSPNGHTTPKKSRNPQKAGNSPPWRRTPSSGSRGTSCAASSALLVVFRQGDRHTGTVGHGQRHCGWAHGVEVQVESADLGRASTHWASQLGKPVGRASTKRPLGEPTFTVASTVANACACLALLRCPLSTRCPLGTVPARHV